jgi:hypothetical protein
MFRPSFIVVTTCLLLAAAARSAPLAHSPAPVALVRPAPAVPRAPHTADLSDDLQRDTLAWVGDRVITALDLVQRIEWMPYPEKNASADMASVKLHALRSLAAEALLARESERRSASGGADLSRTRAALGRALARDALYRQLGRESPPPSRAEITALARRMHPGATAAQLPACQRMAADSLRTLAGQRRAAEFLVAHLAGKQASVDSAAFMMLADTLRTYMTTAHVDSAEGGGLIVPAEATDVLLERLAPMLDRPFAQLPDGPLTLGDALEDMRFYLYVTHSLHPRRFAAELSGQLRLLVEGEIMGREALRRHMDERPEVRHDLRTWTDAWRAVSVLGTVVAGGPAGDEEAIRTFAQTNPDRARSAGEVDLEEVLCGTSEEAVAVRAALDGGAPFDSLARRHSRRAEWVERGGRSGFFPVSRHPELGFTALLSPPGSLLGPLRLPEGVSVFRVLGKRIAPDSLQVRDEFEKARAAATQEQRTDRVARYVGSLASSSRVRFSDASLAQVNILSANMLVRRMLGFGGGMTAAPSLRPMWQWTRYWNGAHAPLP